LDQLFFHNVGLEESRTRHSNILVETEAFEENMGLCMRSCNSIGRLLFAATTIWLFDFCVLSTEAYVAIPARTATRVSPPLGISPARRQAAATRRFLSSNDNDESSSSSSDAENAKKDDRIDLSLDSRLYRIRLPRFTGIEWGTDLSFSFVYVRALEPGGPASLSGLVNKGDQLCELVAVDKSKSPPKVENLMGASFDYVMGAFAGLERTVKDVDLVFFRGTKEDLKEAVKASSGQGGKSDGDDTIKVTVIENKGCKDEKVRILTAQPGVNIRTLLIDNGINVYQSVTRWTNCKVNKPQTGNEWVMMLQMTEILFRSLSLPVSSYFDFVLYSSCFTNLQNRGSNFVALVLSM
jgi:hypothetical protein